VTKDERNHILFITDAHMLKDALLAMLSKCDDMDIIGASDGQAQVPDGPGTSQPDVIVVDIAGTPTVNMTVIGESLHRWPQARIVVLSPFSNRIFVAEVFRAGAHGYVTTQCAFHELLDAIRTVASGSTYLCSAVKQTILQGLAQGGTDTIDSDAATMTDRECMMLQLFAEGRSSKEIAVRLNLSSKTIDACRRQLMQKLDMDSTAGLVKCAIALGLTTIGPRPAPCM
jgi:DNA-binding NarL/FixJ family response regulator